MQNNPAQKHIAKYVIITGIIILMFSGFVGLKITRQFRERPLANTRQSDISAIRSWMTLDYISKEYGVPKPEFEKILGLEMGKYHRMNITQMASAVGVEEDQFIEQVKTIIIEFQKNHPANPSPK